MTILITWLLMQLMLSLMADDLRNMLRGHDKFSDAILWEDGGTLGNWHELGTVWRLSRVKCAWTTEPDGWGSTPCEHERISEVGQGGSTGRTGIEQCTSGEALGKLHTPKCLAPMPSPSLSGGMDASTPLLPPPRKSFLIYSCAIRSSSLPSSPSSRLICSCCCFHSFFSIAPCSLGFSPSCGQRLSFATPLHG